MPISVRVGRLTRELTFRQPLFEVTQILLASGTASSLIVTNSLLLGLGLICRRWCCILRHGCLLAWTRSTDRVGQTSTSWEFAILVQSKHPRGDCAILGSDEQYLNTADLHTNSDTRMEFWWVGSKMVLKVVNFLYCVMMIGLRKHSEG